MSEIVMRVEDLSKRYRIGAHEHQHDTLAAAVFHTLRRPVQNLRRLYRLASFKAGDEEDVIWALRGISFDVKAGEVVGVIGGNGAGKSTLLKVLTRITQPTGGRAVIHGQVSSLLEVGTGFHPELTGRENTYLNGAVLGMTHREITRKFDEIVEFSGVEKFIDTPIKRYSTGMKVRLAFSVAAHLEPDILLVDEVLSVGDTAFQRKCLGKMDEVAGRGRTVLFVSHNLSAVTRLCDRIILLEEGRLVMDGPSDQVMTKYLNSGQGGMAQHEWTDRAEAPGGEVARLRAVRICDHRGRVSDTVDLRNPMQLEMEFDVLRPEVLYPHFVVWHSETDVAAFTTMDVDPEWWDRKRPPGRYRAKVTIPEHLLSEGMYSVVARVKARGASKQFSEDVVGFMVIDPADGTTARGHWAGPVPGVVRPKLQWSTEYSRILDDAPPVSVG